MPHRISVKALIAKDVALRLMWYHWRAGLFMYYLRRTLLYQQVAHQGERYIWEGFISETIFVDELISFHSSCP